MNTSKSLKYTIIYTSEPEGGFTVTVPSLPGCVTYGKDLIQAKKMIKDAICLYIESLLKHKEKVPLEENSLISSVDIDCPHSYA